VRQQRQEKPHKAPKQQAKVTLVAAVLSPQLLLIDPNAQTGQEEMQAQLQA